MSQKKIANAARRAPVVGVCLPLTLLVTAGTSVAGEKLVATVSGSDFEVGGDGTVQLVTVATDEPITGVGFTALWSSVVADEQDGTAPWSLDLAVTVTAPDGRSQIQWGPIGGDRTIADYPLQDFTSGFKAVDGNGTFEWSFTSIGPPWVAGLSDVQYHFTTEVPDVEQTFTGSVEEGPLWDRPFFIDGISGLGPVVYDAIEFQVSVSGGYEIESIVPEGNNFAFLYQGGFDPDNPLENLLDYGLGNGFGPDGSPQGTSWINAMLFEGETYHLVVSQWSATQPGQPYTNTVIGPGEFDVVGEPVPGDLNGDGAVDTEDLFILLAAWGACDDPNDCPADLDGNGEVDTEDLFILLANWG